MGERESVCVSGIESVCERERKSVCLSGRERVRVLAREIARECV